MNTNTIANAPHVSSLSYLRDGADAFQAVAHWHDEVHPGKFWLCMEQPCHAVNRADR